MKSLTKLAIALIVIGVLGLAFNNAFGYETIMYLQKQQINMLDGNHFYIWKIDFWHYIQNIQLTTSNLSILEFKLPTREWINDIAYLPNNLAVIMNWLIMIANIMLYPFKVGSYLIMNLLAILGINTDTNASHNGLKWLVIFVQNILGQIAIPYI